MNPSHEALSVQIVIHPDLVSPERLAFLLEKLEDYAPVLQEIGAAIEQSNAQWFESQGQGTWAPLTEYTLREKAALGYGDKPPLVRTGELAAAISERDAPGHKFLVSQNSVAVGVYSSVIPYASRLHQGDPANRLPARLLIGMTADTIDRIVEIITDWLGGSEGVTVLADAPLGSF